MLRAKLLLAIPIARATLTQAMTESAGASDAAGVAAIGQIPPRAAPRETGCLTEIIAYQTRVFVPVDKVDQILAGVIGQATCKELVDLNGCGRLSS